MTPKEKAKELVTKFRKYASGDDDDYRFSPAIEKENAKLCAVLSVDEIIDVLCKDVNPIANYWFEVKKEIHKL